MTPAETNRAKLAETAARNRARMNAWVSDTRARAAADPRRAAEILAMGEARLRANLAKVLGCGLRPEGLRGITADDIGLAVCLLLAPLAVRVSEQSEAAQRMAAE